VPPYAPAAAHTGPYRVAVLAINRAPEQVGSTLAAGDTVNGEAVDHVGDIDEYSLALPAGTEVNVLFQATGSPATGLELELTDFAPASRLALSLAGDTGLTRQATGTVAVPATGLVRLRVQGRSDVVLDRGAYRLFPFVVKRAPETAGAALAPGDSVVNESIELPGDIDEFLLTVPAPVLLNIWFSALVPPVAGEPFVGGFRMEIENAATGEHLRTTNLFETGSAAGGVGTGPWLAGPATYRLRMAGAASTGQAFRGPYRLFSATSDSAPEGVPATRCSNRPSRWATPTSTSSTAARDRCCVPGSSTPASPPARGFCSWLGRPSGFRSWGWRAADPRPRLSPVSDRPG
jgi:hypothetical protein